MCKYVCICQSHMHAYISMEINVKWCECVYPMYNVHCTTYTHIHLNRRHCVFILCKRTFYNEERERERTWQYDHFPLPNFDTKDGGSHGFPYTNFVSQVEFPKIKLFPTVFAALRSPLSTIHFNLDQIEPPLHTSD